MKKTINRKAFLQQMALISGGFGIGLGSIEGKAFSHISQQALNIVEEGNVLVIIQLGGGNDGLNTLIPAEDDLYQNARPTIGIKKDAALSLANQMYLHPSMTGLKKLYDEGLVSMVQGVGYANPNRSHFRATDIWNSGSDAQIVLEEGWAGRYLKEKYPDFPIRLPNHPMAIQLGSVESLLFQSKIGGFATVFDDPNLFYQLVSGSKTDSDPPPATLAGEELAFLKQIAAASIQYSGVISDAANKGKNINTYPNTSLGKQLSIIAKLIAGGLKTPVYLANIGGFDTHANQLSTHTTLLKNLSDGIINFQIDLQKLGLDQRVCIMTFSEFGRRVNQNGTAGTDHGTAAPMFFIGKNVKGGIIGANPNLKLLDSSGDLRHQFDYRQTYATVLRDHLGLSNTSTAAIFSNSYERLPIFRQSIENSAEGKTIDLVNPWPNPVRDQVFIQFTVRESQPIYFAVYNLVGETIAVLVNETKQKGEYNLTLTVSNWANGTYILSLVGKKDRISKRLEVF
ncbi:MAG: hypothetical protein RJA76_1432 [Bacteroidota bacterium]|jgi:uncharacterized protein (DUF1501 family)